jgi:hypothetical protein
MRSPQRGGEVDKMRDPMHRLALVLVAIFAVLVFLDVAP